MNELAATIDELAKVCLGADEAFLRSMIRQGATRDRAVREWMEILASRNAELLLQLVDARLESRIVNFRLVRMPSRN
jgi:hypothetical protein